MNANAQQRELKVEDLAMKLHSGTIADVLDGKGFWGVLPSQVIGKTNARPVLGQACTVRWSPVRKPSSIMAPQGSTWDAVAQFLLPDIDAGKGKIYVAGAEDGLLTEFALAGGFSAGHFERIGFEAIVLGGAARDAHVLEELDIPIWATNYAPADTQGNYQVKETGTWCRIGNVTIHEGDWIFADKTGVICIPQRIFPDVIDLCLTVESTEQEIERRVAAGERLYDIVQSLGRL